MNKNYWIYAPGENARMWERFYKDGIIAIDWYEYEFGDLSRYSSRDEIIDYMREYNGDDKSYAADSLALWQFSNEIKPGDIIFAKNGINKIIGFGKVVSGYYFSDTNEYAEYEYDDVYYDTYKHRIKVEWLSNKEFTVAKQLPIKTLTKLNDKQRISEYEGLYSGEVIHGNNTEWIFPCNPKYYDIDGAMHELKRIDWFSKNKVNRNDTVYIYVGGNIKAIRYKCHVVNAEKHETTIDDSEFGGAGAGIDAKCVELECDMEYPEPGISYYDLKEHGLQGAIRSSITVSRALHDYIISFKNTEEEFQKIEKFDDAPEGEERESIIKRRVNQSWFREALLQKYPYCCLCGVRNKNLLIASHIKPWAVSDPEEKTNTNNGLILCPGHDKLFDSGYISFKNNGNIMISKEISETDREKLNLSGKMNIEVTKEMIPFLEYHRKNIYLHE